MVIETLNVWRFKKKKKKDNKELKRQFAGTQNFSDLTNHMNHLGVPWCKSKNCRIPFCTIANKK